MRGLFIALMVMGAVWTGGLVWSIFGGLVLVPQSAITVGRPGAAAKPAAPPAKPAASAASNPAVTTGRGAQTGGGQVASNGQAAPTGQASHAASAATAARGNQLLEPRLVDGVKVFDITARVVQWEVAPGELVEAYAYNGTVPGPLLRVTEGDRLRLVFKNELPEPTVVHFHGPILPNSQDGVPDVTQPVIQPGETYEYEFAVRPSGTFMYHTHFNSAIQESKGLYGVLQVDPQGFVPTYDREYFQIISEMGGFFVINGKAFPSTEPIEARLGERVRIRLINLGQMSHPFHSHGFATRVVATDGYPVEGPPLVKDTVNIGPGERYDLEFVADNLGTWVYHCHILSHVQNKGVEPGGMISLIKVSE